MKTTSTMLRKSASLMVLFLFTLFTSQVWAQSPMSLVSATFQPFACNSNVTQISIIITGGTAPYVVKDQLNQPLTFNGQDGVPILGNNNPGTFIYTAVDAIGQSLTFQLDVIKPADLNLEYATATPILCAGGLSTQQIMVTGGTPPYTVVNQSGGVLTTTGQDGVEFGGASLAAEYDYTLTDANGCQLAFELNIAEPAPLSCQIEVPAGENGAPDGSIFLGYGSESAELSATAIGGTPGYTYNWSNGDNGKTIVVSPTSTTVYTATITDANGCTSTCSITIEVIDIRCGNNNDKVTLCHNGNTICVSPNAVAAHLANHPGDNLGACANKTDLASEESLNVYPNPSTGLVNLEFEINQDSDVTIEILNMNGQLIYAEKISEKAGHYVHNIDLSSFTNGVYMLRVLNNGIIENKRIMIGK